MTTAPAGFGEFLPKITTIANQLEKARHQLAALPRPLRDDPHHVTAEWDHTDHDRQLAIEAAEAEVKRLESALAVQQRSTVQHIIDIVSCIPQERENFQLLREAERYLLALAKVQEQVA